MHFMLRELHTLRHHFSFLMSSSLYMAFISSNMESQDLCLSQLPFHNRMDVRYKLGPKIFKLTCYSTRLGEIHGVVTYEGLWGHSIFGVEPLLLGYTCSFDW